jgi:SAM-dependent methyltransferase|tara:strand:- start:5395 stop:5982 length:588 start_codon:yes stop_codon:yes gene_type:complete
MNKLSFIDRFNIWRRKMRWNRQYKKGKWDYLKNNEEGPRYDKIIEYIESFADSKPSVLDLGSGEGILKLKLSEHDIGYFCGIDFSEVSVKKAREHQYSNSEFFVADLHYYRPSQEFDVIVFNEAFYYIHNNIKAKALERVISKLKPNGLLINSIFREGSGCWEYFNIANLEQIEFAKVNSKKGETYWHLGAYRKK